MEFKKISESKKLITIAVIIAMIIIAMVSYTYSFFTITATDSQSITGSAASLGVDLTVTKKAPSNDDGLIPQLDEYIIDAVIGRKGNCIDDNGNNVCQVYEITVKNTSAAEVYLEGTLELNARDNPNLKWAVISGLTEPTLISNINTPSETKLVKGESYESNQTKIYYIVLWISETDVEQFDTGEFTGVVTFKDSQPAALTTLKSLGLDDEIDNTVLTEFTTSSNKDGTTGIYKTTDDLGESYYFRGNVVNNYVKYGKNSSGQDMWWRIIRINGDGSVRMIYDGTSAHANNEALEDRYVGKNVYNVKDEDNAFVGYMNGTTNGTNFPSGGTNSTSYEEAHANITDSTIKTYLDNWYKTNIVDTGYSDNVVDAIYCNDRSITDEYLGYGKNATYYNVGNRNYTDTATPTLICSRTEDKFTKNSILGNGKLTYPVGLITTDELVFGGYYKYSNSNIKNDETYLYNGNIHYWTMSPHELENRYAGVNAAYEGVLGSGLVDSSHAVRPVITLSSSAINDGSGSSTDPFVVIPPPALTTLKSLGLDDEINDTELTEFTAPSNQDGTTGIYKTTDDLGDSYYFRGNVVNNYVKYGKNSSGQDMWWRIIRINGDGSVRMIYDGTSAHANNEASEDRQVGTSVYNTKDLDNAFVGYMNGTTDGTNFPSGGTFSTSYEEAHANITDSTIKTYLDNWYKTNIVDTGYSDNVVDAIYCNDRSVTDEYLGYSAGTTYYNAYNRNYTNTATPTLICSRQEDKFTRNSTLGNGKLTYPVGLITADELVFGGYYKNSSSTKNPETYLYNGTNYYWTMSPLYYSTGGAAVGDAYMGAADFSGRVDFSGRAVRPVITLSSSAINDGSGSSTDPFKVS